MGVNTGGICYATQSCKLIELLLTFTSVGALSGKRLTLSKSKLMFQLSLMF